MSGERLPSPSNTEGNSGDGSLRPRSLSVIDQDIVLLTRDFETSEEANRLRMENIQNEIDRMDVEYADLLAQLELAGPSGETLLSPPDPLDLELPSLPTEDPSNDNVSTPLTGPCTNFVDQLPDITLTDLPADSRSCNICLDNYGSTEDSENPVRLPCGHVVGRSCISRWLTTSNSCPLCRRVLFSHNRAMPMTETEMREFMDSTRIHFENEMGLVDVEAEDWPLTPERRMELAELMRFDEEIAERLRDILAQRMGRILRREERDLQS